ncbi:helix-turn-helix transcriptional regulator [Streptomyces sp. AK02-01A]|uniref:helix-turn-helix domain-containing protein n=1 Tax=Streptomyces sp. AK02-01A TaxID=3028648 RepID=UPI0029B54393|nr:helix-turn-helix transcriptional regulator [Streptomyces sp. AK02-01A]MDX3851108.1 helix-turn-helix transcriptional regulator [Streptomyces sp. AK02-01A]
MRSFRERAGLTLEGLSGVVLVSKSHLSRIETAEYMPPRELPAQLDAAFGTDGIFEELYGLARKEIHPDKYRRRMELEARARVIDEYAGHIVTGLLQTEEYARALFRVSNPRATPDEIEEKVTARLSRQALLTATPAPDLSVILDESALRRAVGGPVVMRDQLVRLIDLVDTPTTTLQMLPFAHGEHALLGGTLTLMTLDDKSSVAYEESSTTGTLLEDPERVGARRRAYDLMRAYALSPRDTGAFIRSVMEALPR